MLELRQQFPLAGLLRIAGLARSTFYYQQQALRGEDKHRDLKASIRSIFDRHKGLYGYRRVTAALRESGHVVNHKTVQRLMCQMKLRSRVRVKKFRRFAGQGSYIAPDLLKRDFTASAPNVRIPPIAGTHSRRWRARFHADRGQRSAVMAGSCAKRRVTRGW